MPPSTKRVQMGSASVCPVAQTLLHALTQEGSVQMLRCLETRRRLRSRDLLRVHQGKLTRYIQMALLALACAGGISCHHTTAHAAPPPAAPEPAENSKPAPPAPGGTEAGANPASATPPSKNAPSDSSPPATPAAKPAEPKPRPAAPAPGPTPAPQPAEAPAPKPAPPQITPRISPAQEAEYKSQTQKSIAEAEANLRRTAGRPLNDVQRDMVEKIQSFILQSREASEIPDWSRARILADKARLLSIELVESL